MRLVQKYILELCHCVQHKGTSLRNRIKNSTLPQPPTSQQAGPQPYSRARGNAAPCSVRRRADGCVGGEVGAGMVCGEGDGVRKSERICARVGGDLAVAWRGADAYCYVRWQNSG